MADNVAIASASFIILYNLLKRKEKRKQRRWWATQLYLKRRRLSNINNIFLLNDLLANKESGQFKNFLRMSEEDFIFLLNAIKHKISKSDTTFRKAIPAEERLAVTLRFLVTGDSFTSLQYLFKISKQLILQIIPDVCQAIIDCLISYVKVSKNKIFIIIYQLI